MGIDCGRVRLKSRNLFLKNVNVLIEGIRASP